MFTKRTNPFDFAAVVLFGAVVFACFFGVRLVGDIAHSDRKKGVDRRYVAYPTASERISIRRNSLNKPLSSKKVFLWIDLYAERDGTIHIGLVATLGRPIKMQDFDAVEKKKGQIVPFGMKWQILGEDGAIEAMWEPAFSDRTRSGWYDTKYDTTVILDKAKFLKSHLILYFDDVDGDMKQDGIVIDIDLSDFAIPNPGDGYLPQ